MYSYSLLNFFNSFNFLTELKQKKSKLQNLIFLIKKLYRISCLYYNPNSFLFAKLANSKASASAIAFLTEASFDKI